MHSHNRNSVPVYTESKHCQFPSFIDLLIYLMEVLEDLKLQITLLVLHFKIFILWKCAINL